MQGKGISVGTFRERDGITRSQRLRCGAGARLFSYRIGRITDRLLASRLGLVDVVEPVRKFTDRLLAGWAADLRKEEGAGTGTTAAQKTRADGGRIGEIFNIGLQDWEPRAGAYALIWMQWCVGHLTDGQLRDLLGRCGRALEKGGMVVLKENLVRGNGEEDEDEFDGLDSSVTR